jgi:tetratricopeptide (TPR) repeat protein
VLVLRASVASELRRYETAASFISRAETLHGEKASILTVKGDWHMAQGQVAEAAESYQKAFYVSPNTATVTTLFRARAANDQVSEAFALMDGWVAENSGDVSARRLYARLLIRERQWDKARVLYEKLMEDGVKDALALNNLAVIYQHLNDQRALMTARSAYDRAPENPSVIDTYGWVLAENGDPKQGLALLRDAYSRLSTEPVIRYHIGLALSRIDGREGEAVEELKAALTQGTRDKRPAPWKDDAKRVIQSFSKSN